MMAPVGCRRLGGDLIDEVVVVALIVVKMTKGFNRRVGETQPPPRSNDP